VSGSRLRLLTKTVRASDRANSDHHHSTDHINFARPPYYQRQNPGFVYHPKQIMQLLICTFLIAQLLLRYEPAVSFQGPTKLPQHQRCRKIQKRRQWPNQVSVTIMSERSSSIGSTGTKKDSSSTRIRKSKPRNNNKNKYDISKAKKKTDRPPSIDQQNDYPQPKDPTAMETWRIYGISVHPDDLVNDKSLCDSTATSSSSSPSSSLSSNPPLPSSLQEAIQNKLKLPQNNLHLFTFQIVRRSLDARKKLTHPVYNYVVDISMPVSQRLSLKWRPKPGRMELLSNDNDVANNKNDPPKTTRVIDGNPNEQSHNSSSSAKKTVVIVGMGPAGLFCALQLALKSNNTVRPILLDRGQPVEKRGRDIGALMHRRSLDSESNFAFGEGGAGTWSDGKLTTRIGRNSETVRWVLELLVEFGAPSNILYGLHLWRCVN
jgi:hypothetical protein